MQLSRRDFVRVGVAAVALCGVGAAAVATHPANASATPLRPPGGQDEGRLLSQCVRCDRCRSACPTDCISVSMIEDGILGIRTPVMDFRQGGCIFCDRCINACPTDVLGAFDPHADKIGMAQIDPETCIAFRSPGSCERCKDHCDFDAIVIIEGHPVVVRDRCNGCGMCQYVCPAVAKSSDASTHGIDIYTLDTVVPLEEDKNAIQSAYQADAEESGEAARSSESASDGETSSASDSVLSAKARSAGAESSQDSDGIVGGISGSNSADTGRTATASSRADASRSAESLSDSSSSSDSSDSTRRDGR
jgi:ferredoxin-type protein NapG